MHNNNSNNDFAFIHIRPGIESKEHPLATIAISTISEDDFLSTSSRFAIGFAAQHVKKDRQWNAAMGRNVARGRAEKSAKRIYVHADRGVGRRDLMTAAVVRVLEAVEAGELFATKKATRALQDTLTRFAAAKFDSENRYFANEDLAAE